MSVENIFLMLFVIYRKSLIFFDKHVVDSIIISFKK